MANLIPGFRPGSGWAATIVALGGFHRDPGCDWLELHARTEWRDITIVRVAYVSPS